jgi:hypothetical protein
MWLLGWYGGAVSLFAAKTFLRNPYFPRLRAGVLRATSDRVTVERAKEVIADLVVEKDELHPQRTE